MSGINRRHFLRTASLSGLAVPAGAAFPASQENKPKESEAVDRVAAIALAPPPTPRPGLVKNPPAVLPAIELEAAQNNPSVDFPERHIMRTREELEVALADRLLDVG